MTNSNNFPIHILAPKFKTFNQAAQRAYMGYLLTTNIINLKSVLSQLEALILTKDYSEYSIDNLNYMYSNIFEAIALKK